MAIYRHGDGVVCNLRPLQCMILAMAAVSLFETEWIRRVRATGTILRPRVNVIDGSIARDT